MSVTYETNSPAQKLMYRALFHAVKVSNKEKIIFFFNFSGSKRARISVDEASNEDERDSDSGDELALSKSRQHNNSTSRSRSRSRSRSHSRSRSRSDSQSRGAGLGSLNSLGNSVDGELTNVKNKGESVNDSEGSGGEAATTPSPVHTPPLTPALTPQREDTPAPENLSLRKPARLSPQHQTNLQPVDLVQARHQAASPPPSLAVS